MGFAKLGRSGRLGLLTGVMAWSAYAVVEFVATSVFFRIARPYSVFTPWHWELTGLLVAAYLATGAFAGFLIGIAFHVLSQKGYLLKSDSRTPPNLLRLHGATLSLVVAFAAHLIVSPTTGELAEKVAVMIASFAFAGLLLAAILSDTWSRRIGLLVNPWIVSCILLAIGRGFVLRELQSRAEQFGGKPWLWSSVIVAGILAVAAGSILLGRWLASDGFSLLNWAAAVLAVVLLAGSFWLARVSPAAGPRPAGNGAQPNVLMIVMDTVRADHLSVYGYTRETTPHLKALAEDSAVYTQAISASDFTLTSHATLFTGMYASWHGAYCQPPDASYGQALAPQIPTLAGLLSAKGYRTLGVAANLYLRADFGLQRGFETFQIPRPVPVLSTESKYLLRDRMRRILSLFMDTSQFDRQYSRGDEITRTFFDALGKTNISGAPFFAFLNYMDAHFPYIPPAPYDRRFPGKNPRLGQEDLEVIQDQVLHGARLPEVYGTHSFSQYDGGIAYIDAQIGELVDWLKEQKLYDNTTIVVTSDHGEAFGEKGLFLHANSAYQNLIHVALLVKFPHGAHRGIVDEPVSLTDVLPTILSTQGYPVPPAAQGRSLLHAASEPRSIYAESFPCPVVHPAECPQGCLTRAVISWPDKFITSSSGRYETYNLSKDPEESQNLFGSLNPVARKLRTDLAAWIKMMPAQPKQELKLDPEALQRLKSLGYVGGR